MSASPTNADLGCAIRRLRRDRRLTIETLALDADMHPTYLSGIERGIRNPTWDKIGSLASTLGVSVSAIVETAEQEAEVAQIVRDARAQIGLPDDLEDRGWSRDESGRVG